MYTSYISYILYIAGRVIPSKKFPPINIPFIAPGLHSAWKMQHYTKRCSLGRIQNIWICLFANICISCRDATIFGEEGIIGMQTVTKWDVTLAAARPIVSISIFLQKMSPQFTTCSKNNWRFFQAVNKMGSRVEAGQRTTCILEIGDQGIKMVDKSKPGVIFF